MQELLTEELARLMTLKPHELTSDENFLSGLELPDYKINLYLIWRGGEHVTYICYRDGKLLFSGEDFKPSPLYGYDSLQAITSCLGFLTVKPGDTDREYFKDYTPEQLEWANCWDCEQLGVKLGDLNVDEYEQEAVEYFTEHFIQ